MNQSTKISIRIDQRGFLSLQCMILTSDKQICFVEYLVSMSCGSLASHGDLLCGSTIFCPSVYCIMCVCDYWNCMLCAFMGLSFVLLVCPRRGWSGKQIADSCSVSITHIYCSLHIDITLTLSFSYSIVMHDVPVGEISRLRIFHSMKIVKEWPLRWHLDDMFTHSTCKNYTTVTWYLFSQIPWWCIQLSQWHHLYIWWQYML